MAIGTTAAIVGGAALAGGVASSVIGARSADKAADAQREGIASAERLQQEQFESYKKLSQPFISAATSGVFESGSTPQYVNSLFKNYIGRTATEQELSDYTKRIEEGEDLSNIEQEVANGIEAQQYLANDPAATPRGALAEQQGLLGLLGTDRQQELITGLEQSPLYQSLARQGEEALLQNASATGGLRGGNIQGALAQYRPAMLQGLIDRQVSNLGGLIQIGQNSSAGQGQAGNAFANNLSNLAVQAGDVTAQNRLAKGQAWSSGIGAVTKAAGTAAGGFFG